MLPPSLSAVPPKCSSACRHSHLLPAGRATTLEFSESFPSAPIRGNLAGPGSGLTRKAWWEVPFYPEASMRCAGAGPAALAVRGCSFVPFPCRCLHPRSSCPACGFAVPKSTGKSVLLWICVKVNGLGVRTVRCLDTLAIRFTPVFQNIPQYSAQSPALTGQEQVVLLSWDQPWHFHVKYPHPLLSAALTAQLHPGKILKNT